LKVVPPFTDFQTPPLAEPTMTVNRPFSSIASTAAIRPLMVADPMLRAGNPEIVAASNFADCAEEVAEKSAPIMETDSNQRRTLKKNGPGSLMSDDPFWCNEIFVLIRSTKSLLI
jgi:hypothetical protein